MAKQSHMENTVGPWAQDKLDGLEAYLGAYTTALKKQRFRRVYIDAFAGAGRYKVRTESPASNTSDLFLPDDEDFSLQQKFIEGSPRRALGIQTPFHEYYFFDADPSRAALLNELSC